MNTSKKEGKKASKHNSKSRTSKPSRRYNVNEIRKTIATVLAKKKARNQIVRMLTIEQARKERNKLQKSH